MAYSPKTWADHPEGGTVIDAASLNNLEQGLATASATAEAAATPADLEAVDLKVDTNTADIGALAASLSDTAATIPALSICHVTWASTALSATTTTTLTSISISGDALTASSGLITVPSDVKYLIGQINVYTSWSGGTGGRRRWQVITEDDAQATVSTIGGNVLAAAEYYTGDRTSIPLFALGGTSFYLRPYVGTACNAGAWGRFLVVR